MCLKSLQEFVRLQTFSRSGFQQIQLDIQFLRTPLREIVEDEAAVDFLLDEVVRNSLAVVLIFHIGVALFFSMRMLPFVLLNFCCKLIPMPQLLTVFSMHLLCLFNFSILGHR